MKIQKFAFVLSRNVWKLSANNRFNTTNGTRKVDAKFVKNLERFALKILLTVIIVPPDRIGLYKNVYKSIFLKTTYGNANSYSLESETRNRGASFVGI